MTHTKAVMHTITPTIYCILVTDAGSRMFFTKTETAT